MRPAPLQPHSSPTPTPAAVPTAVLGHYSADGAFFAGGGAGTGPITALADGTGGGNGVYAYGPTSAFPSNSYNATNYWVDAVFDAAGVPTGAPTVTATAPDAAATGVADTAAPTATFSAALDPASLHFVLTDAGGATVPAVVSYDAATRTATLTPTTQLSSGTAFTASVTATDAWGHSMPQPDTWTFTTSTTPPPYSCPCTLFAPGDTPAVTNSGEYASLELGVRFTAAVDGTVTGITFYKGSLNTGTHTGTLWAADGRQLATGTFTGESASGWQTLTFATPVAITAGTTYVASYHAPDGNYSYTPNYFDYPHTAYPLTAPAGNQPPGNGVFAYEPDTSYPVEFSGGTNYWVSPVFAPAG